jgi:hypothetical protein
MNELNEMTNSTSIQWRSSIIEAGRRERQKMGVRHLIKRGLQFLHGLLAFCFVLLAIVEFIRDPPYFDAVAEFDHRHDNVTKIPKDTFYNLTRTGAPSSIRHFMDMPVLMLFLAYFVVLLWRHAWGAWSSLMTICMCVILFVFILVNYIANDYFDWRFFNTRGYGILLEVFCFALGWTSVVIAVFIKMEWFPLVFTVSISYTKIHVYYQRCQYN